MSDTEAAAARQYAAGLRRLAAEIDRRRAEGQALRLDWLRLWPLDQAVVCLRATAGEIDLALRRAGHGET